MTEEKIELLRKNYAKINNSFSDKRLVFHIGTSGGFFSEYNNMIFAMLYCLKNHIRFVLFSSDANFSYEKGWNDFFLPFCDEEQNRHHAKYNRRIPFSFKQESDTSVSNLIYNHFIGPVSRVKYLLKEKLAKAIYFGGAKKMLFTHELWNSFHSGAMQNGYFEIPEMEIKGDVRSACSTLVNITWMYQPEVGMKIRNIISTLCLPKQYIGFHIRGGDKIMEFEPKEIDEYIDKATTLTSCRSAFVLTDDYRIIEKLNRNYQDWEFYTLCDSQSQGYYHESFSGQDKMFKRDQHINLFASIDLLSKSELFVGTFNSNVGMYLGMQMEEDKCIGIDVEKWAIF